MRYVFREISVPAPVGMSRSLRSIPRAFALGGGLEPLGAYTKLRGSLSLGQGFTTMRSPVGECFLDASMMVSSTVRVRRRKSMCRGRRAMSSPQAHPGLDRSLDHQSVTLRQSLGGTSYGGDHLQDGRFRTRIGKTVAELHEIGRVSDTVRQRTTTYGAVDTGTVLAP